MRGPLPEFGVMMMCYPPYDMLTAMNKRIEAEPALTEDRRLQYPISGISGDAIDMLDIDGGVGSWNTGAQRFQADKAPEIPGRHFSRFHTAV